MNRILPVLALSLFTVAFASAELVTNGGFEADVAGNPYSNFNVGSSGVTGWTITGTEGQNVSLLSAGYLGQSTQQLDLSGVSDTAGSGISQTLATVPGQVYNFSFLAYTGVPDHSGVMNVFVDAAPVYTNLSSPSATGTVYATTFTALTASTTLSFVNVDGLVSQIDDVSVTAVPEPASMAVLGLGLAAFKRRRKNG